MRRDTYLTISFVFYLLSIFSFAGAVFFFVAYRPQSNELGADLPINAYVVGDAYNYIINAGRSTALMVMTLCCLVVAMGCTICSTILSRKEEEQQQHAESRQPGDR